MRRWPLFSSSFSAGKQILSTSLLVLFVHTISSTTTRTVDSSSSSSSSSSSQTATKMNPEQMPRCADSPPMSIPVAVAAAAPPVKLDVPRDDPSSSLMAAMMVPQQQEAALMDPMMMMEQGTIMSCHYCSDIYPELAQQQQQQKSSSSNNNEANAGDDDDANNQKTKKPTPPTAPRCPMCGGNSGPRFRAARMMDRETSSLDILDDLFLLAEQDRKVREMDVGIDVKSVTEEQKAEFAEYKRRLFALYEKTQLYQFDLGEALKYRIYRLDDQFAAKPEDKF